MAEAFLNGLPRVGRGILERQDQRCSICMEDYGTTPAANGIIERAVRLPCQHVFGSVCISDWVSSPVQGGAGHNTCPLCRHELFQIEHPLMSPSLDEFNRVHTVLEGRCEGICALIGLQDTDVLPLAAWIATVMHDLHPLGGAEPDEVYAVAAASVFMASHLMRHGKSVELIASCFNDVEIILILRTYSLLLDDRHALINAELFGLDRQRIDDVLPHSAF